MRAFDLSPLYRTTIGFDRLSSLLDQVPGFDAETASYPPYNIERLGDNEYRISMAIAGFNRNEVTIEVKENALAIRGQKADDVKERKFLHRGIAARSFERRFQLADHVEVTGADLKDGLLHVDFKREVPERLKVRTIEIGQPTAQASSQASSIELQAVETQITAK